MHKPNTSESTLDSQACATIQSLLEERLVDGAFDDSQAEGSILDSPDLVTQMTRTRNGEQETIVAYHRLTFKTEQKRQVLHIPFVPPLKYLPQVEAHAMDAGDVRIRITDTQKFGIRAEVILAKSPTSTETRLIELIATETTAAST